MATKEFVHGEIERLRLEIRAEIAELRAELKGDVANLKDDIARLRADMEKMGAELRHDMTVRLGAMITAGVAVLGGINIFF